MRRTYAIGDIHGQLAMLRAAHEKIELDRARTGDLTAEVIHLGDYTDRGPDSFGTIEFLINGVANGSPWRFLLGNHDRMLRMFFDDPYIQDPVLRSDLTWLNERLGGRDTLASYAIKNAYTAEPSVLWEQRHKIPNAHLRFLVALETHIETDDLFFAHAGIRPGTNLKQQIEDDLIWIRGAFHDDTRDHGKIIVHGHTPVDTPTHYGNRVNLDTGAGYGNPLTVAVFEDRECWVLTNAGREKLLPVNTG